VLLKQSLHRCAVVEQLIDDSQHLVAVLEVGCKQIDVNDYVD